MSIINLFEKLGLPTKNAQGHELGCSCVDCQTARRRRDPFAKGSFGELLGELFNKHKGPIAEGLDTLCGGQDFFQASTERVELELPEDVPPWRKCDVVYAPDQFQKRIDSITYPAEFHLEGAMIGNEEVGDMPLPWGPIAVGQTVRMRFSNDTLEPRRIVVRMVVTRYV